MWALAYRREVPFRTPLSVRHDVGEDWRLLEPLVFQGSRDFFVVRKDFRTDFASIPRPVRWLFDSAGTNSQPGVLHDALWRESKRTDGRRPRVDPWDADGVFRRALRESGATVLTRALMWIAVRAAAIAAGRVGSKGPAWPLKLANLLSVAALGIATVGAPTAVAVIGRVFYWVVDWLTAVPWAVVERLRGQPSNLPWPAGRGGPPRQDPPREYLLVLPLDSPGGRTLSAMLGTGDDTVIPDEALDRLPPEALESAY